jgi:hypothetical protein
MAPPAAPALAARSLLRSLLRSAAAFPDYNVRAYALRRVRLGFAAGRALAPGGDAAAAALADARAQLAMLERQRAVAGMFGGDERSVMEASAAGAKGGLKTR